MDKPRVVFIRSNPVSPYPRLEKSANCLKKQGYQVHILAWDRNNKYHEKSTTLQLNDSEVEITRFGIPGKFGGGLKSNLLPLLKFQLRILFWLIKNFKDYDVIHAYDFDTGWVAHKIAYIFNKALVYDIADYYIDSHALVGSKIGYFVQKAENRIINNANAVIICTEKRRQQIVGTQPNNLTIIHNSPYLLEDDEIFTRMFRGDQEKLKMAYIGILSEGRFLEEVAEVTSTRNDCEFHVAGFGNMEGKIYELSKKNDNIFFYGRITYNETIMLESLCDLLLFLQFLFSNNHFKK